MTIESYDQEERALAESDLLKEKYESYKRIVYSFMTKYDLRGFEEGDWLQEGFMVFWKSNTMYDSSHGVSFGSFFKTNFHRHLISLLRKQGSAKRNGGRREPSLNQLLENQGEGKLSQSTFGVSDSVDLMIVREQLSGLAAYLSDFELRVWLFFLEGKSIEEIAQKLLVSVAQVGNATDRIKRKVRMFVN